MMIPPKGAPLGQPVSVYKGKAFATYWQYICKVFSIYILRFTSLQIATPEIYIGALDLQMYTSVNSGSGFQTVNRFNKRGISPGF